jgi:hypothetical protein
VRRKIEAEAQSRADQLAQATREAARKRGAADNVHLIESLVALAAENDPTSRATALAALSPELRRVLSAGGRWSVGGFVGPSGCIGTGAKLGVPVRAGYFRSCSWTGGGAWSGF